MVAVVDPGGEIRPWPPPSKLAMEFGLLGGGGGRKSNDSIVNVWECQDFKDFGPPYRCRLRIWPPCGKI